MNRIVAWFATNHVAANLLMGFAILAGLASLTQIPVKLYPDVDLPIITVTVEYLGAAPEEVESGVCTRIEEHLEGLEGIKELRAIASEGVCTVQVELFFDADRQRAARRGREPDQRHRHAARAKPNGPWSNSPR